MKQQASYQVLAPNLKLTGKKNEKKKKRQQQQQQQHIWKMLAVCNHLCAW